MRFFDLQVIQIQLVLSIKWFCYCNAITFDNAHDKQNFFIDDNLLGVLNKIFPFCFINIPLKQRA